MCRELAALVTLMALSLACRSGSADEATDDELGTGEATETSAGEVGSEAATEGDTTLDETGGPGCGDGVIQAGEECDDGADNGPVFACLADCTLNACGDGNLGPDEGCDDGNQVDADGCDAFCQIEDVPPGVILCDGKIYQCGDAIDNDQDGKIDLNDPECITPCDDDETSFKTNLPGQNNDCKQDCYFDSDSGAGNDQCEWNLKCDPENPGEQIGCAYDPDFGMCNLDMPQQCLDVCVPLVPNGCDCFGCCEIAGTFVYLDSSADCSIDDMSGCESCTFFPGCNNPCMPEACELCFGQSPDELPDGCDQPSCPPGVNWCLTMADCEPDEFCQTGCCIPLGS